ncbi:DUF3108 domain-containing protein [Gaoshiqia sp. Z1-71]|uniref:DUF3108 domain-containing protein n=1 Tax=Gaoshiqia hydrogeniformans TaxID=3290090 RepID=UPI003BF83B76
MKNVLLIFFLFSLTGVVAQPVERLKYELRYGFIKGGTAVLKASNTVYENKPSIHYHLEGKTVGLADKLFSVHDIYESTVNPETFLPYKAIRNIKERKYRYYNEAFFFHDNDSIFSQRSGGRKVPPNLVDMLSAFFYLRHNHYLDKLDKGEEFKIPVFHADKEFVMVAKYLGTEKISTKIGEIECHIVSPYVDKGKLLKRSDGLKFYITKDANRIPLLLEFDMNIGALKCELKSYKQYSEQHGNKPYELEF